MDIGIRNAINFRKGGCGPESLLGCIKKVFYQTRDAGSYLTNLKVRRKWKR
jgi:hypothetical protein